LSHSQNGHSYLVIGGGGIQAAAIVHYLVSCRDTERVTLMDIDREAVERMMLWANGLAIQMHGSRVPVIDTITGRVPDVDTMADLMRNYDVAIGTARYSLNVLLTKAAIKGGIHFCDLGGNNTVVQEQHALSNLAAAAGSKILPDCGIAPGAASVLAHHAMQNVANAKRLFIFCGGLPQEPEGDLLYERVFDPSGLVNEYDEVCNLIRHGRRETAEPLTGLEEVYFPGYGHLQAAHTSGGLSTLVETYDGKLDELCYQTLRYLPERGKRSHWEIMRMYRDLGWFNDTRKINMFGRETTPRQLFEEYLRQTLPTGKPDMLFLMVICESENGAGLRLRLMDKMDMTTGLSAMQRTTGYSIAICARMLAIDAINETGTLKHELHVPTRLFLDEWQTMGINVIAERI
jgi:lysine 6-dehydrogenase